MVTSRIKNAAACRKAFASAVVIAAMAGRSYGDCVLDVNVPRLVPRKKPSHWTKPEHEFRLVVAACRSLGLPLLRSSLRTNWPL